MKGITLIPGFLTTGKDQGSGLMWRPGQVVTGQVAGHIADNTYFLSVNGRDIIAHSPYLLARGQKIVMEVLGQNEGRYMVRLLNTGQGDVLGTIIEQLELNHSLQTRQLVHGFLIKQLPLNRDLLQKAELMLQKIGGGIPETLEAILQLIKSNKPLHPRVLESLHAFFAGEKEKPGGNISSVVSFNREAAVFLAGTGESTVNIHNAKLLMQQVNNTVNAMILQPGDGAEKVTAQLLNLLGAQLPVAVPGKGEGGAAGSSGQSRQETGAHENTAERKFSSLLDGFSRMVREIRMVISNTDLYHEGQKILRGGEKIELQMAGQQIFQSLKWEGRQQNYLYFNLPVIKYGETETWGQLRILKDAEGQKSINPDNFAMTVFLNTPNLGPLILEIKVCQREVTAAGKVQEEHVSRLLEKNWPQLQDSFTSMGYKLHPCRWQIGNFEKGLKPLDVEQFSPGMEMSSLDRLV